RAEAAELTLTNNLASEVTRAEGAEGVLTTSVNLVSTNLGLEVTRAEGAESTLTTSISTETSRATAAEALKANLAGGNTFTTGSQILALSTTNYSSLNIPVNGAAPSTLNLGDLFTISTDNHLQFQDATSTQQAIAFMSDVTASNSSVATETARAEAAELTLTNNLASEVTRAEGAEGVLTTSVNLVSTNLGLEVTRAEGAESTLTTSISTETSRATAAEALKANLAGGNTFTTGSQILALSTTNYSSLNIPVNGAAPSTLNLGDLFTISTDNHLQFQDATSTQQAIAFMSDVTASNSSVATETARAEAAELTLTNNLASEVTRAEGAEGVLTTSVNLVSTNLGLEVTRAEGAESTLTTSISTETSRATAAEALKANLAGGNTFTTGSQILALSTTGYSSLNIPVNGAAPSTLNLGDLFTISTDNHLQFQDATSTQQAIAFMSDVTASNSSVATETARAEAAELTLTNNLASEVTRAEGAEGVLTTSVNLVSTNLGLEVTRAEGAESTLTTSISTETSRATAAEALKANLAGGNTFTTGSQILALSTTGYSSLNIPVNGAAPSTLNLGDLFTISTDNHLQFQDATSTQQAIAFMSDVTASNSSVATETARAEAAELT